MMMINNASTSATMGTTGMGGEYATATAASLFPCRLHQMLEYVEHANMTHIVSWVAGELDIHDRSSSSSSNSNSIINRNNNTSTSNRDRREHEHDYGGSPFKVHDQKLFTEQILPQFFNQTKFKSFQRQLNLWGFQRQEYMASSCSLIANGNMPASSLFVNQIRGSYRHPLFQRRDPKMCQHMTRRKQRRNKKGGELAPMSPPPTPTPTLTRSNDPATTSPSRQQHQQQQQESSSSSSTTVSSCSMGTIEKEATNNNNNNDGHATVLCDNLEPTPIPSVVINVPTTTPRTTSSSRNTTTTTTTSNSANFVGRIAPAPAPAPPLPIPLPLPSPSQQQEHHHHWSHLQRQQQQQDFRSSVFRNMVFALPPPLFGRVSRESSGSSSRSNGDKSNSNNNKIIIEKKSNGDGNNDDDDDDAVLNDFGGMHFCPLSGDVLSCCEEVGSF
eukprot:CAMPEP_0113465636 /NCGR_PEP_ID=MMETSP0014_2-20120614/13847_1 /TAXON_ID=2857 /ORGANISM="Nitzschia sp." /LENGTH=442 /DNA_ID=CAMNT_0000357811 /DNA_START=259 /DNA_END=1587 /DNA_ORIENTATION=+ /assembly_acc=CAM_ASM_000159